MAMSAFAGCVLSSAAWSAGAPALKGVAECSNASTPVCEERVPTEAIEQYQNRAPGLYSSASGQHLDVILRTDNDPTFTFGEAPYLCCDIQTWMRRLDARTWGVRLRIEGLNRAAFGLSIINLVGATTAPKTSFVGSTPDHDLLSSRPASTFTTVEILLASDRLGATRSLSIFRGRNCRASTEGCRFYYVADGGQIQAFLASFDPADEQLLAQTIIVGIHNAPDVAWGNLRMKELLPGADPSVFARFESFVLEELLPFVEGASPASPDRRIIVGTSNGAAWALEMATTHRDRFGGAFAFSVATSTHKPTQLAGKCFFVGGGTLEDGFVERTTQRATSLRADGATVAERYLVGGHSPDTWSALFSWAMRSRQSVCDKRAM